jgi:hypothetical protein
MRTNTVFLAAGILGLAFGVSFLLIPATVLPLYGVAPDAATVLMSRFFGVALVHLGLALYLIREVRDPDTVRALALAGIVGSACGAVVALLAVLGGVTNALGWSTVAIYALLLLGYAVCLKGQPAP